MVNCAKYILLTLVGLLIAFPSAHYPDNKAYAENDSVEYWAVIVGVADYLITGPPPLFPIFGTVENYDLTYADDDAIALAAELSPIWGANHILLLVDEQATRSAIQNAITGWLDSKEDANDVVLFFFAGHGIQYSNHEYIMPYDTLETSYKNDIQDDTLASWLNYLESRKQVIVIDTCNSGGFIDELSKSGRVVLTASGKNEDSYEDSALEHSVFTYYILDSFNHLDDVDDNSDNIVSIEEVFTWAESKIIAYSEANPPAQHPRIDDSYYGQLGLYDAGNNKVENLIWPYVAGAAIVVAIIANVIVRKKYLSPKRVRRREYNSNIWEDRESQEIRSIHYELAITSEEAGIGTKKVLTRGNRRLELTIPRGVTHGSVIRLTDALLMTDNKFGDILVTIIIKD